MLDKYLELIFHRMSFFAMPEPNQEYIKQFTLVLEDLLLQVFLRKPTMVFDPTSKIVELIQFTVNNMEYFYSGSY